MLLGESIFGQNTPRLVISWMTTIASMKLNGEDALYDQQ